MDEARLAEATALVGDVLNRTPDSLPGLTLMSRLLLAGNAPEPDLAIRNLRRAVDLYPGRVNLYPRLVILLQEQGDLGHVIGHSQASFTKNDGCRRSTAYGPAQGQKASPIE